MFPSEFILISIESYFRKKLFEDGFTSSFSWRNATLQMITQCRASYHTNVRKVPENNAHLPKPGEHQQKEELKKSKLKPKHQQH